MVEAPQEEVPAPEPLPAPSALRDPVAEDELARKYRDTMVDIQSKLFDRAAAYNSLIMVGGYAGSFTIWGNVKGNLPPATNFIIAILLGISLALFIAFQVYKMSIHVDHFRRVRKLLNTGTTPETFFKSYNEIEQSTGKLVLESRIVTSRIAFWCCVGPAIAAILILFYNSIALVAGFHSWPPFSIWRIASIFLFAAI